MSVESSLGGLAIGSAFAALGMVFALNYRGVTTWHVRTTYAMMSGAEAVLKRVPPRSRLLTRPVEQRITAQVRRERAIGVVFVLIGVTVVLGSFGGLIGCFLR